MQREVGCVRNPVMMTLTQNSREFTRWHLVFPELDAHNFHLSIPRIPSLVFIMFAFEEAVKEKEERASFKIQYWKRVAKRM